jgi:hypothetical protein
LTSDVTSVQTDVDDLVTLSGVAVNSTNLGSFTGSTITDNTATVKSALQELEDAVEAATPSSLQAAYNVGNSITTSGGNALTVSGSEQISLTSADAVSNAIVLNANNVGGGVDIDAGGVVDIAAGGAVTINGGAASTLNTTSANLTLSTTTSGTLAANSAGGLDLDGSTGVTIDANTSGTVGINAAGGAINIGDDAVAQPINIGTGAAARTITVGNTTLTNTTETELNAARVDINAGANGVQIDAAGASNLTTTAGLLTLAGDDGVAITSSTSVGVTIDAATAGNVEINSAAGEINIGNDADANAINIGTGAAARTITLGNATGATAVNIDAGTGGVDIDAAELAISGRASIGNTSFLTAATSSSSNQDDIGSSSVGTSTTIPLSGIGLGVNGDIVSNANIYASGALTFSDERYKKDIESIENANENISKLEGVRYNWRKDEFPDNNFSEKQQIGLIAQEVEKVFPELVNTLPNGYKTVNYQALVPVLIEALKEQQKLIDKLIADLSEEKASAADLKSALAEQQKLSSMQLEIMSKLQSENSEIKSDVEMLKELVLGTKTADKKE